MGNLSRLTRRCFKLVVKSYRINNKGRTFVKGQALSHDIRRSIIDAILQNDIANTFKVSRNTVKNIWERLHNDGTIDPKKNIRGGNPSSLSQGDLELIEALKNERPTCSLKEIHEKLEEFGNIPNGTSYSSISRALKERMLSGKHYSRKKISTVAQKRFTIENIAYTQLFIDYLYSKDPFKLKFFDECGLKTTSHGRDVWNLYAIIKHYCEFTGMFKWHRIYEHCSWPIRYTYFSRFFWSSWQSCQH